MAEKILMKIYEPFGSRLSQSAEVGEMIKYAANDFLALKIFLYK
jgi:UDP-glucose 6-dehydrogenase